MRIALLLVGVAPLLVASHQESNRSTIAAGQWEFVTDLTLVEAPGMSKGAQEEMRRNGFPSTELRCLTETDPERWFDDYRNGGHILGGGDQCVAGDVVREPGTVSAAMTCGEPGADNPVKVNLRLSHTRESMILDMAMVQPVSNGVEGDIRVQSRTMGRRLGPCPEIDS